MLVPFSKLQEFFAGCEYHEVSRRLVAPRFSPLNRARFNVVYGGNEFLLDPENVKLTRNAWKAAMLVVPRV